MVLCRYVPPFIEGASSEFWYVPIFFPMIGCLLILIWWLAASRATWREKGLGLLGIVAALATIVALSHASMRGILTSYFTLPLGMVALAVSAALFRNHAPPRRLRGILLVTLLAMSVTLLMRSAGVTGAYAFDFEPRWTSESGAGTWSDAGEKAKEIPTDTASAIAAAVAQAEWPGFRGADRAGHSMAPKIATDWAANPPKLLWKKPVGAGWSSFAVARSFVFTQEQRSTQETVVCYDLKTGDELWAQGWEARFDEPMGGPGPRATPTLSDGAVFAYGGLGILVRLKARTGEIEWQQDVKALSGREKLPMWGFSSSPLVTQSLVIVYAGGAGDKGVMAFDATTGEPRWSAPCGPESYSSPQLSTILGEEVVLMLTNDGLLLLEPATGKVRLNYAWKFQGYRALQPTVVGDDTILLPTPMSEGTRAIRLSLHQKDLKFLAEDLWTSRQLKTDFSELIAHEGYLYGIDGSRFSCLDLKTGERVWKQGSYGKGQALLLDSSGVLLIAAEDGRVVLVKADPAAPNELASIQALEGKTWNHPVVAGDRLLVRNGQEMACYGLPVAK